MKDRGERSYQNEYFWLQAKKSFLPLQIPLLQMRTFLLPFLRKSDRETSHFHKSFTSHMSFSVRDGALAVCLASLRSLAFTWHFSPPHSRTESHPQAPHHTEVQSFTVEGTNPAPVVPPTAGRSVLRGKSVNQFCSHTQSIERNNGNKTSFWDENTLHYQDVSPHQLIFINNGSWILQERHRAE